MMVYVLTVYVERWVVKGDGVGEKVGDKGLRSMWKGG